jgi:hypothetical protein
LNILSIKKRLSTLFETPERSQMRLCPFIIEIATYFEITVSNSILFSTANHSGGFFGVLLNTLP